MSAPQNWGPQGSYTVPTPPSNSGSGGCLKAAGITCGVLLLLIIGFGFWVASVVKQQVSHPNVHNPFGVAVAAAKAATDGIQIQQAILKYHTGTGKYPEQLSDLVPDYLPDGKILHNDLDPNPSPGHVSWTYTKPPEGADPKTPILKFSYDMGVNVGNKSSSEQTVIVYNLDGTTSSTETQTTGSGQPTTYTTP